MLFVCIFREIHHSPIPLSSRSTHPFFTKHTQLIHTSFIPLRGTRCTHPLFTHMLNSISPVFVFDNTLSPWFFWPNAFHFLLPLFEVSVWFLKLSMIILNYQLRKNMTLLHGAFFLDEYGYLSIRVLNFA